MLSSSVFACRKRRRPILRRPFRQPGAPAVNPSRRHRLRFNTEMERLARLLPLPPHVRARLDKLSVLRLALAFLRSRAAFQVRPDQLSLPQTEHSSVTGRTAVPEGDLMLHALNGFVIVITMNGTIFYASHTVEKYLGFHQCDIVQQSMYDLVHPDDHVILQHSLSPSSRHLRCTVTEAFSCRCRCLLQNSLGFVTFCFQGRVKGLSVQLATSESDDRVIPAFFAIASPVQTIMPLPANSRRVHFQAKEPQFKTHLSLSASHGSHALLGGDHWIWAYPSMPHRACGLYYDSNLGQMKRAEHFVYPCQESGSFCSIDCKSCVGNSQSCSVHRTPRSLEGPSSWRNMAGPYGQSNQAAPEPKWMHMSVISRPCEPGSIHSWYYPAAPLTPQPIKQLVGGQCVRGLCPPSAFTWPCSMVMKERQLSV
uniref:aryl hydrocarbon receptor-like n=1 Tax=Myxine glutinosa TaxID=7769 RepID=UPI00358F5A03